MNKPAISLAAVPGRRKATIELAKEIEKRGFQGIYLPSFGDAMGLAIALALETERIPFGTTVQPIYLRQPSDFAAQASFIHEVSGGRFWFGIGVTHGPVHQRLRIKPGKPLSDIRAFVEGVRKASQQGGGELPPIVLATLRDNMLRLSAEIAEGAVWANGSRSRMGHSLGLLPADKRNSDAFFIGNMIPTCIADDREAAAAVMRKTLTGLRHAAELPQLLARRRVRRGDAGDPGRAAGQRHREDPVADVGQVAVGRDAVRDGGGGARGCREVVRGGGEDADPGAVERGRRADEGVRGAVRGV